MADDQETPEERRIRLKYEYDQLSAGKPYYARNMAGKYVLVTPKGPGVEERISEPKPLAKPSTLAKPKAPAKPKTLAKPKSEDTKGLTSTK